jgi:hypothetical protein
MTTNTCEKNMDLSLNGGTIFDKSSVAHNYNNRLREHNEDCLNRYSVKTVSSCNHRYYVLRVIEIHS